MAKPIPEKVWVKAAPGRGGLAGKRRVPKEHTMRRFITEHEAVQVELTAYYLRKLASGELLRVPEPTAVGWSVQLREPAADDGGQED